MKRRQISQRRISSKDKRWTRKFLQSSQKDFEHEYFRRNHWEFHSKTRRRKNADESKHFINKSNVFKFDNMTMIMINIKSFLTSHKIIYNSLNRSVIYDFECFDHLTFNEKRLIDQIRSTSKWVNTSNELMHIKEYDIMKVKKQLNVKEILMHFANIAWISIINVILMSSTKLEDQGFDRCLWINTLLNLKTKQKICDIDRAHKLLVLKYNEMIEEDFYSNEDQVNATKTTTTNAINSNKKTIAKAISWQWHLRMKHCHLEVIQQMKHCHLEVIQQMKHLSDIEMLIEKSLKTVECETCAVSKMHRIIQKASAERVIKSFQMLHFDLIIDNNQAFDEIRCIAHFIDELINFSWVYSLIDHKEKTLISVFREVINQCDRAGLIVKSMIRVIRCDQETFVELQLKNWVTDQNIKWQWSAKHISEQNDKSERFEALLIEKARCIREFVRLSEDLNFKCYLAVIHLLNRISIKTLNWNSSLIVLQRCLNELVRWKISHLKVFDCKAYVLLKKLDASARSKKLKSRAFVSYLIEYDSINIFGIWNSEKWTISEYRDVIFDENAYYDIYNVRDLIIKLERKKYVRYKEEIIISQVTNQAEDLDSDEEEWQEMSIRDK